MLRNFYIIKRMFVLLNTEILHLLHLLSLLIAQYSMRIMADI